MKVALAIVACALAVSAVSAHKVNVHQIKIPHGKAVHKSLAGRKGARSQTVIPVTFDRPGFYGLEISVGNPAATVMCQIDTGSSTFAVRSTQCNCGSPAYNPLGSSSASVIPCSHCNATRFQCGDKCCYTPTECGFFIGYGDGSGIDGVRYRDDISIGGGALQGRVDVGAVDKEIKDFFSYGLQGIIGMAYNDLNNGLNTTLRNLVNDGVVDQPIFGLSFTQYGGSMTWGSAAVLPTVQWTNVIEPAWYVVSLSSMGVNGNTVGSSGDFGQMTIVDSGTTALLVTQSVYQNMIQQFVNFGISQQDAQELFQGEIYVTGSASEMDSMFPALEFNFSGGPSVKQVASNYLTRISVHGSLDNWIFIIEASSPQQPLTILGDAFMRGHDVVFDQINNRVGFA